MSSGASSYVPGGRTLRLATAHERREDAPDLVDLVPSSEPAVVFSSLAAGCVPAVCARCTIEIIEDEKAGYRIEYPIRGEPVAPGDAVDSQLLSVPFTAAAVDSAHGGYRGTAAFGWTDRAPTSSDRLVAELLVQSAVRTVAWQRSDQQARELARKAEHLAIALQTSRQIGAAVGILMSGYHLTATQAFDVLREASQRAHRKLRDVALDVLETGCVPDSRAPAIRRHERAR